MLIWLKCTANWCPYRDEWVVIPLNRQAVALLHTFLDLDLQPLDPVVMTRKAVVVGVRLPIPTSNLVHLSGEVSAKMMLSQKGHPTYTVVYTFAGTVPNRVILGPFGKYATVQYIPEPLGCFRCQLFGHNKTQCHAAPYCAMCSNRHETAVCMNKKG